MSWIHYLMNGEGEHFRSISLLGYRRVFGVGLFIVLPAIFASRNLGASSGTNGAAFLDIPVGAGPAALGSAYTAAAQNAYAPVWNPAALGSVRTPAFAGEHVAYLAGIHYEYAGLAIPLIHDRFSNTHGLGVSAQYLGSGEIDRTDIHGDSQGTYSSSYGAYSVAYGRNVGQALSFGMTGKWIHAAINGYTANAYAMDLASSYRMEKVTWAAALDNVGTRMKFINAGDPLPLAFHLSSIWRPQAQWDLLAEGVYSRAGTPGLRAGTAWRPAKFLELRAGFRTDSTNELSWLAGCSTGIGIHVFGQEFSYAWAPRGDLGDTQYFSLVLHFGSEAGAGWNFVHVDHLAPRGALDVAEDGDKIERMQLLQMLENDGDVSSTTLQ